MEGIIKVYYLDPPGNIESILGILKESKAKFELHPITQAAWGNNEQNYISENNPIEDLPAVEIGGQIYTQKPAIMVILGTLLGFYPGTETEEYEVFWFISAMRDLLAISSEVLYTKHTDNNSDSIEEYFTKTFPLYLTNFESKIGDEQNFLLGEKLTIADFTLIGDFEQIKSILELLPNKNELSIRFTEGMKRHSPNLQRIITQYSEKYYPRMGSIMRYKEYKHRSEYIYTRIPEVIKDHVIIKVDSSPINPVDDYYYNQEFPMEDTEYNELPCGREGSGIIIAIGTGVPKNLLSGRVAFHRYMYPSPYNYGCWCTYARIHYMGVVLLDQIVPLEDACGCFVNPLTAIGFIERMKIKGYSSAIHTAAASAFGQILLKLCIKNEIELLCVVRREEQADLLRALGAKYIYNQKEEDFEHKLKERTHELGTRCCWDAIGGEMAGRLINLMPDESTIFIYGLLSHQPISGIDPLGFIAKGKKIRGFLQGQARFMGDTDGRREALEEVAHSLKGENIYKVKVARRVKPEEHIEEVSNHGWKKPSQIGKTIFKF